MSPGRLLLLIVFPAIAGLWIGLSSDRSTFLQVSTTLAGAGTPAVGASSSWGQHVPRSGSEAAMPVQQASLRASVATESNPRPESPRVAVTTYLDPMASVIGDVEIGERVYVAPFASIRSDAGHPIHIGAESNVQDAVVIHGLPASTSGESEGPATYEVGGRPYAVYVGDRVSLAHQANLHGPAWIEDDVFVGMQALVSRAHVGRGSVVEPASKIIGVNVPPGRYVPAGSVVTSQSAADALPEISSSYGLREINRSVVHVNTSLADAYLARTPASAEH